MTSNFQTKDTKVQNIKTIFDTLHFDIFFFKFLVQVIWLVLNCIKFNFIDAKNANLELVLKFSTLVSSSSNLV